MPDTYKSYRELNESETEGIDFNIRVTASKTSSTLLICPHAGRIEPGISEIILAVAGQELSTYLFEGIKQTGNRVLHITSSNFDEPRCLALISESDRIIAIHGEQSDAEVIYLGGLDTQLGQHLKEALTRSHFMVKRYKSPLLQGISPKNICNRGKSGKGVQLELSNGLRRTLYVSLYEDGPKKPTKRFFLLVEALRTGLQDAKLI